MISNKLLFITMLILSVANALDIDELLEQDEIQPSFDCSKVIDDDKNTDELYICNKIGVRNSYENKVLALTDNFYSSYYQYIINHINHRDKRKIKQISLNMIKERKECLKLEDEIAHSLPEGANPIIPLLETTGCMQESYLKAFKQITEFIYKNHQYKDFFEKIFYLNPKEYYDLIMTTKISESATLFELIKQAAKDNLIDKTGKLII